MAPVQGLLGQWWGQCRQLSLPQVLGWVAWCGAYLDEFLGYAGALWAKTGIQACRRAKLQVCRFFWARGGAVFVTLVQGLLGQGLCGLKLGLKRPEGQNYRFTACLTVKDKVWKLLLGVSYTFFNQKHPPGFSLSGFS